MDITFSNVEFYSQIQSREYVHCYVTHVQATSFNPLYFGMEANQEIPDSVMTTPNSNLPFTIAQIRDPSLTLPGAKIYKIFSNTDISNQLDDIFIDVSDFNVKVRITIFYSIIYTLFIINYNGIIALGIYISRTYSNFILPTNSIGKKYVLY